MAGEPIIRPATIDDAEAMLAIYAPVVTDTAISFELTVPSIDEFRRRIQRAGRENPWLVATSGGRGHVVGYAYASEFRSRPAYARSKETTVYVEPGRQGTGVGRRLLVALLDELRRRGAHVAVAGIALPNDASVGLHQALGFEPVGTFTEVGHKLGRWHDVGFWQLRLSSGLATPAERRSITGVPTPTERADTGRSHS